MEIQYKTSRDHCLSMIDNEKKCCSSCGGEIQPLETVDNSGAPTFWAGCLECFRFDNGVDKLVYATAKEMVVTQNYVRYSHMGPKYNLEGNELKYWEQSQISGTCGLILQVLHTYQKIKGGE